MLHLLASAAMAKKKDRRSEKYAEAEVPELDSYKDRRRALQKLYEATRASDPVGFFCCSNLPRFYNVCDLRFNLRLHFVHASQSKDVKSNSNSIRSIREKRGKMSLEMLGHLLALNVEFKLLCRRWWTRGFR